MNTYLIIILAIMLVRYLLSTAADILNVRSIRTELPQEFEGHYDADKYRASQEYLRENTRFDVIATTVNLFVMIVFILVGGFNYVDLAARAAGLGDIMTGVLFAGILILASQLLSIPFSIYETFVIEEKYGFNRMTPKTFIMDLLKAWLIMMIIGIPVLAGILWLFEAGGENAWLYCWIGLTVIQVILVFIAPVLLMPLFNKFIPLEEGELLTGIENYAREQNFKMQGVFKMDGSKRSSKSNAFFTGFGSLKRIVLFDTLIEKHTVPELVSVMAHEMGHYKKGHIQKTLITGVLRTGLMFYLLSFFIMNEGLNEAFKMQELSIHASLFFFGFLYAPITTLLGIVQNVTSRKAEYEADKFAANTYGQPEAMISALKKLTVDNLSNLHPHRLLVMLSYSHPPVLQRIEALRKLGTESDPA